MKARQRRARDLPPPPLLALAAMVALGAAASSQPVHAAPDDDTGLEREALITDRPTQAASSRTVGAGYIQLELGADTGFEGTAQGTATAVRTPTKIRFGLADRLELHLETAGIGLDIAPAPLGMAEAVSGISDVDVGFKWNALAPGGRVPAWVPSTALILAVNAPIGSTGFGAGQTRALATLAADFDLPGDLGLGANLGLLMPLSELSGAPPGYRFAAAFSHPMAPISRQLDAFVEFFGEGPFRREQDALLALDGGLIYQVVPVLQIDLALRGGVLGDRPVAGFGFGATYRI